MFRKVVRNALTIDKQRRRLSKLLRLITLVGFLWILAFPYMAQDSFTSENALNGTYMTSLMQHDELVLPTFERLKDDFAALNDDQVPQYVFEYL